MQDINKINIKYKSRNNTYYYLHNFFILDIFIHKVRVENLKIVLYLFKNFNINVSKKKQSESYQS